MLELDFIWTSGMIQTLKQSCAVIINIRALVLAAHPIKSVDWK